MAAPLIPLIGRAAIGLARPAKRLAKPVAKKVARPTGRLLKRPAKYAAETAVQVGAANVLGSQLRKRRQRLDAQKSQQPHKPSIRQRISR